MDTQDFLEFSRVYSKLQEHAKFVHLESKTCFQTQLNFLLRLKDIFIQTRLNRRPGC
jgi:hypothetical protein